MSDLHEAAGLDWIGGPMNGYHVLLYIAAAWLWARWRQ